MNLPVVQPEREPLTEAEARRIGHAATRIARFRYLLGLGEAGGSINVTPGRGQLHGENLAAVDVRAVLALLIEREGQFLSSFGVILEETPK